MRFLDKVNKALNRYHGNLKSIAEKQLAEVDKETKRKLAKAKTQTEKLRIKAEGDRKKAHIYKEYTEAKKAAQTAAASLKSARMEAGDLTTTEQVERAIRQGVGRFQRGFLAPPKKKRKLKRKSRVKVHIR